MGTIQKDPIVTNVLKNLCCSYGWSYGIFWRFEQPNSLYLTMQDAYFDEKSGPLIDDLFLQVPMLGGGIIGQAAFTKKHMWMSSEDYFRKQNSSGSIWDMFLDDSGFHRQFSSGIKTVLAIPVEPQAVVQFGSTEKIMESIDFINQTNQMFHEIVNGGPEIASCSSSNSQSCPPNGLFASLISSQDFHFTGDNHNSAGPTSSSYLQFTGDGNNGSATCSSLTSLKELPKSNSPLPLTNSNHDLFDSLDEFFQTGDFNFNIQEWLSPSFDENHDFLSQSMDEKVKSLTISGIDVDLLGNTGDLADIVSPAMNSTQTQSQSQHVGNDYTALVPKKGLFSKLGIDELLEGISGTSHAASTSCVDDHVSKRRKTGNSVWEMKETIPKSELLEGISGNSYTYNMNHSSKVFQAKDIEPLKPTKKKAKPGTRPRPKDRQQILDRMAELRELIPNGAKMSIDCLLDRTIKHMLFLQNVTKHAERIKQADEPKHNGVIDQNNFSGDPTTNGVTWACELGNQTMICPLIVEDLTTPGQMLIEMLCEERGFFLEIVDIIRGFRLTIVKGVMEVRDDKVWARFIVEAEAKRHVTRHEIFSALVQLLQTTGCNDNHLENLVMGNGGSLLNNFQQSGVQLPISLEERPYYMNL